MSDKTELLPCPFCGAAADGDAHPHPVLRDYSLWRVACDNPDCMADVHGDTLEQAIAAWNRRVDARITALEAENARLRKDSDRLDWVSENGQGVRARRCGQRNLILWQPGIGGYPQNIREAIDAARGEAG